MKILCLILSFIMLGQSFLPCSDSKSFVHSKSSSDKAVIVKAQQHEKDYGDLCNPFCSCFCCGVTQDYPKGASLQLQVAIPSSAYTDSYLSAPLIAIAIPIWQPPQLAV